MIIISIQNETEIINIYGKILMGSLPKNMHFKIVSKIHIFLKQDIVQVQKVKYFSSNSETLQKINIIQREIPMKFSTL